MRDIAVGANMLSGSVYYHFASKEELLVAVYGAGVSHLERVTRVAVEKAIEPWARLEALCRAHMEVVLKESDYAQVLIRVLPDDIPDAAELLRDLRGRYESMFREVVAGLPLPPGTDRRALRLMLLGTLNSSLLWFDPQGRDSPRVLARKFVGLLKESQNV